MEGWTKKKGGWTRVVNGTRENLSNDAYAGLNLGDLDDLDPAPLTRKEIQDTAKSLGINAKQTSKDLLSQIKVAESK